MGAVVGRQAAAFLCVCLHNIFGMGRCGGVYFVSQT